MVSPRKRRRILDRVALGLVVLWSVGSVSLYTFLPRGWDHIGTIVLHSNNFTRHRRSNDRGGPQYADSFGHFISSSDAHDYHTFKADQLLAMDEPDTTEKNDTVSRNVQYYDEQVLPSDCYRPGRWSFAMHPNCLVFHEVDHTQGVFLGTGHTRETQLLDDRVVLKQLRVERNHTRSIMAQFQMEAMVMTELHTSPHIMNVYGHCAGAILVQRGWPITDTLDDGEVFRRPSAYNTSQPRNNYTIDQKLQLSISMAEGLAELHGNRHGVLVNGDLSLDQWLLDDTGHLRLNDFNRVIVRPWNSQQQRYCRFWSSYNSILRAQEELGGGWVDESTDVCAFGRILYILLTGLRAYGDKGNKRRAKLAIWKGELPYLHPEYRTRSVIESRLVEIMERSYAYRAEDRPTIFEVIAFLRQTAREVGVNATFVGDLRNFVQETP